MSSNSKNTPKDSEIVANGFRRGEPLAAEQVRLRVRKIVAFRGYGIPLADRQDLEQEIMAQLWTATRRPSFDATKGFWGLAEVIAARRCIDWRRGRRDSTPFDPETPDAGSSQLQTVLSKERSQLVSRALDELGDPCRRLIELHFQRRKSYRELAGMFDKKEGALRMQMVRCIRGVRRILDEIEANLTMRSPETTG